MENEKIPIELLKKSLPNENMDTSLCIDNIQRVLCSFRSKCTS